MNDPMFPSVNRRLFGLQEKTRSGPASPAPSSRKAETSTAVAGTDWVEVSLTARQSFSASFSLSSGEEGARIQMESRVSQEIEIRVTRTALESAEAAREEIEALFGNLEDLLSGLRDVFAAITPKRATAGENLVSAGASEGLLAASLEAADRFSDLAEVILREFFEELLEQEGKSLAWLPAARLEEVRELSAEASGPSVPADFAASASVRIEWSQEMEIAVESGEPSRQDPLVIDLDGDGIETVGLEEGVKFDITGDGRADRTAWVGPDDGLLVWDRNRNGRIDGGRELFGDQNGAANGFAELRKLDGNQDGKVDANDERFQELQVWRDRNGDGKSQECELQSVQDLGIAWLATGYRPVQEAADAGKIAQRGVYGLEDGTILQTADVLFDVRT